MVWKNIEICLQHDGKYIYARKKKLVVMNRKTEGDRWPIGKWNGLKSRDESRFQEPIWNHEVNITKEKKGSNGPTIPISLITTAISVKIFFPLLLLRARSLEFRGRKASETVTKCSPRSMNLLPVPVSGKTIRSRWYIGSSCLFPYWYPVPVAILTQSHTSRAVIVKSERSNIQVVRMN